MEYTSNFTLSGEGKYYIEYYSIDNAGNQEGIHNQTHYIDNSEPMISNEFLPIDVEEDEGLFKINFSITDNYDPNLEITGVILLPVLDDPEIEFKVKNKVKIENDLEENEVEIKAPNPEELWEEIQEFGGIIIENGREVYIEPDDDPDEIELKFTKSGLLKIEEYLPTLQVTAEDFLGNSNVITVEPVFEEDDDDDDD